MGEIINILDLPTLEYLHDGDCVLVINKNEGSLYLLNSDELLKYYDNFVMKIRLNAPGNYSFTIKGRNTYTATIYWGDGGMDTVIFDGNDQTISHSYATSGDYIISITGDTGQIQKIAGVDVLDINTIRLLRLNTLSLQGVDEEVSFNLPNTLLEELYLYNYNITSLSFTNLTNIEILTINNCTLTGLDISINNKLNQINLQNNGLTVANVDDILVQVDNYNTNNGTLDLRNNSAPTSIGLTAKANLESRGWTVYVDV